MRFLFFAPHAELWAHSFPEALVAEMLAAAGHDVTYVGCGKALNRFCVPMAAHKQRPDSNSSIKGQICARCQQKDAELRKRLHLNGPSIAELVAETDRADIDRLLQNDPLQNLIDLRIDGIDVGKLALYQLMIRSKRLGVDLSAEEEAEYREELRNTLLAHKAGTALIEEHRFDAVIVYNALYSVNRAVCKIAEQKGIPHYFMHAGGNMSRRLQTLWIGKGDTFSFFPAVMSRWADYMDSPCSETDIQNITAHYLELLRGASPFVYSSPKLRDYVDVRGMFGISAGQRILVATLGSYDEERAAEIVGARKHEKEPLFASQLDWIRWLIDLLRQRHDLFLIIRVHPREFPNKRDAVLSHHALELRAAFEDLPVNVAINWPDKKLSMYDLADCADAFLNSWSSVGKEMALLGLPTVMYAPQLSFYPAELGFWGDTERTYRDAIDRALASGWSFERARYAYRWFVCDFVRATLEIGESFPKGEGSARGTVQRVVEAVDRRWLPGLEQLWDISRRSYGHDTVRELDRFFRSGATTLLEVRPVVQTSELDERREEAAIRDGLKEIANVLFPTSHSKARSRLYPHLVGLRG